MISFDGFLLFDLVLGRYFGNHGLWCAMLGFMLLRAITLGLRLPSLERKSFAFT
jgi:MATE family multidrug resistance protein